jgi:predicted peptidase
MRPPLEVNDFLLRRAERDGTALRFRVYVPSDYDHGRSWPAVLFLHGAGERGNDSIGPTLVGLGRTLAEREAYPAIVVFPQCPKESHWAAAESRAMAMHALDEVMKEFNIDPAKVALTGISMGAAGAWLTAADHPRRFMSLAPICGWVTARSDTEHAALIRNLRNIPTWIFHGSADPIVPVESSRKMAAALRNAGADVRYTELSGVGHNSWDRAYGESELLEWLLDPV